MGHWLSISLLGLLLTATAALLRRKLNFHRIVTKLKVERKASATFLSTLALLSIIGIYSSHSLVKFSKANQAVAQARKNILQLERVSLLVKNAETGQRGYLLTGNEEYLKPYNTAPGSLDGKIASLRTTLSHNPGQLERIGRLEKILKDKLVEMSETIRLRRERGYISSLKAVQNNRGLRLMNEIHAVLDDLIQDENIELTARSHEVDRAFERSMLVVRIGAGAAILLTVLAIFFVNSNIRERLKESEVQRRLFETTLEQMPSSVIICEAPSGRLMYSNPRTKDVWRHEMHKSKNIDEYGMWKGFHPDGRPYAPTDWPLARAIMTGAIIRNEDTDVLRGDGSRGVIRLSAAPVRDEMGKVVAGVVVCEDVTEVRQLEREHTEARVRAQAALAAAQIKSEFLANMSHEIRTPMNGIIGMTDLLLKTSLTTRQKDFVDTVRLSADSLLTVINDILDFSKLEAGKLRFEVLDFNLRTSIEGVMDLLSHTAQSKGVELVYSIDPKAPLLLKGDHGRLRQVLTNLLGNALKFTSKGQVDLEVSCEQEDETKATLLFKVRDTGVGIRKEELPKLFKAFSQADSSTARKYGGTGLGLAISEQLVKRMEGMIEVQSEFGEGSLFSFTARFTKGQNEKDVISRGALATPGASTLRGKRILVVDDNETNLKHVSRLMEMWNLRITSSRDSRMALELLKDEAQNGDPFQLALIDMGMPFLDGLSLAKKIREDSSISTMPLLLMMTQPHKRSAEMESLGIAAELMKPLKQSYLLDAVIQTMSGPLEETQTTAIPRQAESQKQAHPAKILIVEDNTTNRRIAVMQLEELGYVADAVTNGLEALAALEKTNYDIILMDCQMPEMDGFQATAAIRKKEENSRHTVIIAMTANALEGDREQCLEAGMDDYLTKPTKVQNLRFTLERWLKKAHAA
ncbi:MAG: response regulator [Bdellovibrionota bacterium]